MNNFTHFIGIDVSKKTLDVCALKGKKVVLECRVMNAAHGFRVLKQELRQRNIPIEQSLFCLENTGIYNSELLLWANRSACKVWLENAIAIKKSIDMYRGKNDKVDAHRIASYAFRFKDQCRLWEPPRESLERLKRLITLRTRLLKVQMQCKVPLKESSQILSKKEQKVLENCSVDTLRGVKASLEKVEAKIRKLILKDVALARLVDITTSVRGIGWVTALSLIVTTSGFTTIKVAQKLACYAGIAPFEHRSGTSIRGKTRVSHLTNKNLGAVLDNFLRRANLSSTFLTFLFFVLNMDY